MESWSGEDRQWRYWRKNSLWLLRQTKINHDCRFFQWKSHSNLWLWKVDQRLQEKESNEGKIGPVERSLAFEEGEGDSWREDDKG